MKLRIITIGEPKLAYARNGWTEYLKRLQRYHSVEVIHLADKFADDTKAIVRAAGDGYKVALVINAEQLSSEELAVLLEKRAMSGKVVSFIIGGPDGLPTEVITQTNLQWSLSRLTFPHDLAMVILLETLYRASTINAAHPYHRGM